MTLPRSSTVDVCPMNTRILAFDLDPSACDPEAFEASVDSCIERTLQAYFPDLESDPAAGCGAFSCTGYWPASLEDETPS